ncbi:MAG: class II glutamine amidotransferase [Myxococcales bacterium]|nr:class II glutamine amidotransferase [Myxococcales bacterium]
MCQLLALHFNEPVRPSLSFRGFRTRGAVNPDGWGIARWEGPACQLFKEPCDGSESALARFLSDYPRFESTTFIGHVRRATSGTRSLANTHPFVRVFLGRAMAFAHNGTVELPAEPSMFESVGETDSERLFCTLLTRLSEEGIGLGDHARMEAVLSELNKHGTMNVVFSNGERLWVYHDREGYGGLFATRRLAPFQQVRLQDEEWTVDLAEDKRPTQRGYVIATVPLTKGETWSPLEPGRLYVYERGEQVYPAGD